MNGLHYLTTLTWAEFFTVFLKICVLGLAVRFVWKFCLLIPLLQIWQKRHSLPKNF